MSDEQTHSLLLVVLGATAVWLWWSGQVLNHIRPGLAPGSWPAGWSWSGWGCCPLGLLSDQPPGQDPGGHHQRARPGWLLLVPVLVVLVVQPAALGS